jgi:hypothetical protein
LLTRFILLAQADVKERFFTAGMESGGGSPQEFGAAVKTDIARIVKKP